MSTSYKELPDYNQFIQSYFVDQELLNSEDAGTAEFKEVTSPQMNDDSGSDSNGGTTDAGYGDG
jgi:hypothetical protein